MSSSYSRGQRVSVPVVTNSAFVFVRRKLWQPYSNITFISAVRTDVCFAASATVMHILRLQSFNAGLSRYELPVCEETYK